MDKYYTIKEVLEISQKVLGRKLGRTKCYELLKYGQIKSIKKDKYYYVKQEWLEDYLSQQLDEKNVCIESQNDVQYTHLNSFSNIDNKQIQEETQMNTKTNRPNPFLKKGKTRSTWYYWIYKVNAEGKLVPRYKGGFATEEEAKEAKKKAEAEEMIKQSKWFLGKNRIDCSETLENYLLKWFNQNYKYNCGTASYQVSAKTTEQYEWALNHAIPYIGKIKLDEIKRSDIKKLIFALLDEGLSSSSCDIVRRVLSVAFNAAIGDDLIEQNTCTHVKVKSEKFEPRQLNIRETNMMLDVIHGEWIEPIVKITLALGLRLGEVLGLKFEDFDIENRTVIIRRQIGVIGHEGKKRIYGIKEKVKTDRSNRTLGIDDTVIDIYRIQKAKYQQELKLNPNMPNNHLLFFDSKRGFLDPTSVSYRFHFLMKKYNIADMRFHDLRGTSMSIAGDMGVQIEEISKNAGHSSIKVTERRYIRKKEVLYNYANAIEDAIFHPAK